jgi:hypothetical protein
MQIYIIRNGVTTYLSESAPLEVVHIDKLGASAASRITERSPGQDGDSDIDHRLEPRTIPIILQARIIEGWTYTQLRALINERFRATNVPIALGFIFDDGSTYQIDTQSIGDLDLPLSLENTLMIKVPVILRAANPTFYDPITTTVNFQLSASGGAFFVPSFVPTFFGGSTLDQTIVLSYDGTYPDFPLLTVYGPITNFKIVNDSTGAKLDLTGFTINSGDYYTFDLRYGRKLVYKNGVTSDNRINEVTSDSQLATFNIEADPTVSGGLNQYHVTGTSATGLTKAVLQYHRRFDGI